MLTGDSLLVKHLIFGGLYKPVQSNRCNDASNMNDIYSSSGKTAISSVPSHAKRFTSSWLKSRLFGISLREITTEYRRFCVDDLQKKQRIEQIGSSFLQGYHAAIESESLQQLSQQLSLSPLETQGFAYEGASMGIALLDRLFPWRSDQWAAFLASDWNVYPYLTHVGLGWALARLPGGMGRFAQTLLVEDAIDREAESPHSLLACLALDGYGFHQAYFAWEKYVQAKVEPSFLPSESLPVFRQGVGRSLCFVLGLDPARIAQSVGEFPRACQSDLWSGVGLAAAYAGGFTSQEVQVLQDCAGWHRPALAQGVAFATKARQRARVIPQHTRLVCGEVWRRPAEEVAQLCDTTLADLPLASKLRTYALWRQRIQEAFASANP